MTSRMLLSAVAVLALGPVIGAQQPPRAAAVRSPESGGRSSGHLPGVGAGCQGGLGGLRMPDARAGGLLEKELADATARRGAADRKWRGSKRRFKRRGATRENAR